MNAAGGFKHVSSLVQARIGNLPGIEVFSASGYMMTTEWLWIWGQHRTPGAFRPLVTVREMDEDATYVLGVLSPLIQRIADGIVIS